MNNTILVFYNLLFRHLPVSTALVLISTTILQAAISPVQFHAGPIISNTDQTGAIVLGDINNDGKVDLILSHGSNGAMFALGDGNGGFAPQQRIGIEPDQVQSLALGDVDADGDLDLLVGRVGEPIRLYLNNGHGDFAEQGIEFSAERVDARNMALADVDADGDLDLVAGAHNVAMMLFSNDGSGRFSVNSRHIGKETVVSTALAFGDIDGDSDVDLVSCSNNSPIRLYLNNGAGEFSSSDQFFDGASAAQTAVLADIDNDGDLDIFASDGLNKFLYINNAYGVFTRQAVGFTNPEPDEDSAAFADIDGDGDLDLVVTHIHLPNEIYLNDSNGRFHLNTTASIGGKDGYICCAAFADLDGDHDLDLVTVSAVGRNGVIYLNDSGKPPRVSLHNLLHVSPHSSSAKLDLSSTTPPFTSPVRLTNDMHAQQFAVADIDMDGDNDVVVSRKIDAQSFLTFYRNNGNGELAQASEIVATSDDAASSLLFADMDSDGRPDLLVSHFEKLNVLYHNNGDGTFASTGIEIGLKADQTKDMVASDIDGDGDLDLVTANYGKSKRYINDGGGNFGSGRAINRNVMASHSVVAADIDKDGDIDIILGNDQDGLALHENIGDGVFDADGILFFKSSAFSLDLTATDLDQDGDVDLFASGSSSLALHNDGLGHFSAGNQINGARKSVLADVDLDKDIDLITGDFSLETKLFFNDGHAGWLPANRNIDSVDSNKGRAFILADMDGDTDPDLLVLPSAGSGLLLYSNSTRSGPADERIAREISDERITSAPVIDVAPTLPTTAWERWQVELNELNERYNISGFAFALLVPLLLYLILRRDGS